LDLVQNFAATILPELHFERKVIFPTILIGMTDKSYQPTIAGLRAFVAVA
jgi:LysR family transcriptional regulator, hydrogen peroxide-inducible genes activator